MQECEKRNKSTSQAALPTSTLFKPRQVLLNSISNMKHEIQNGNKSKTLISLTNEQRTLLLQSICQFLEQNGFSKSLKNFSKEADVEKESWKSCLLNLEEMCCQYLKLRNDTKVSDSSIKEQAVEITEGAKEDDGDKGKKSKAKVENESVNDVDVKKKNKKSKKASDCSEQTTEENGADASLSLASEPEKKSKDKKKKKKKKGDNQEEKKDSIRVKLDEMPVEETLEKPDTFSKVGKKEKSKSLKKRKDTLETTEVENEKKSSKKRKKPSSEENENDTGCVEEAAIDDAKHRETENSDQSNGAPKTPNGSANGVLENGGTESHKKNKSGQLNGSTEARTAANAFRRVKEEEVEFVDEKLQDNSYWAKDGADSGYGAKAQEVLGQVRGRDFRHEKTKKKRGSYRGGQIDLHSHSFKFNYDDDEE